MDWKRTNRLASIATPMALALMLPLTMGAEGDGCAVSSMSPAPDVHGWWDVTYDDRLGVRVTIGGSVYEEQLGAGGGSVTIDHDGQPITFELDCARPEILCPSEAWPLEVYAEQRNATYPHRMIVTLPEQVCMGQLVEPEPSECGAGTLNEACDAVCDGPVTVVEREKFGVIGEAGETFRLYLGAGIATNGINCALLGVSYADADLATSGRASSGDWQAIGMDAGVVTVGYAGGCLWAGDPDDDGSLEALVLGAGIEFTTGFTATRRGL